jgi:hypothetical protein
MGFIIRYLILTFAVTTLLGCAAVPHPEPVPTQIIIQPPVPKSGAQADLPGNVKKNGVDKAVEGGQRNESYQIVRYIGADSSKWKKANIPHNYSDLYTRIVLTTIDKVGATPKGDGSTGSENALRDYSKENRYWLSRLWKDKTDTVTTLSNFIIRDPDLKVSVPLFSISHASGPSLGNSWITNFTASTVESPLFRIGPNTGITIHLSSKISSDSKSQGVSLALGAVTKAVQIAAPTSTLLTPLSKSDITNTANAIDSAISGLLSHDIAEDIQLGRLADSWDVEAELILYGCAPFIQTEASNEIGQTGNVSKSNGYCGNLMDLDGKKNTPIGIWSMTIECPRISAFDPRSICNKIGNVDVDESSKMIDLSDAGKVKKVKNDIAKSVSDSSILQFNLSSQISVQSFIQIQSWYNSFIGKSDTKTKYDYAEFCSNVVASMETAGLSKFDAELVYRAMVRQMPQLTLLKADFNINTNGCTSFIEDSTGQNKIQ